ncbi:MAG: glycosyltransferase [bacterium]|nr:glycosyltransferase [bacterium]
MELNEDVVDIIVPFFRTPDGEKNLEALKQSLEDVNPGFPYRLIIAEGQRPCIQNRNAGLKQSSTRYFVMVDDDVVFIQKNWLKDAVEKIKSEPRIGAVGFRIENKDGKVINAGRMLFPGKDPNDKPINLSVDCVEFGDGNEYKNILKHNVAGCCILIDRLVAGYYPEAIYPGKINAEDVDYMMTIQANGFSILYLGTVAVIHNEKSPEEKLDKYKLTDADVTNHVVFRKRWDIIPGKFKNKPEDDEKTDDSNNGK